MQFALLFGYTYIFTKTRIHIAIYTLFCDKNAII